MKFQITILVINIFVIFTQGFRCPDPLQIQQQNFAQKFNLSQFFGAPYYELALHDYTQPSICGCQRSVKSLSDTNTYLKDNFTMVCPWNKYVKGKIQISDLSFNFTEQPGILLGHWNAAGNTIFVDTIVAVGEPKINGDPYRWALEFQCVEEAKEVIFIGINFYSRDRVGEQAQQNLQEMLQVSQQQGIEQYWKQTNAGLRIIDHTDCFY